MKDKILLNEILNIENLNNVKIDLMQNISG